MSSDMEQPIKCRKHDYKFVKNFEDVRIRYGKNGNLVSIKYKGLYKCSLCKKEYIGRQQHVDEVAL